MANRAAPALALRPGDAEELGRLTRSSSVTAGIAQRARIVLLASQGVANTEIAGRVGVARQTVLSWRDRYERSGLAGLEDEARSGRPRHRLPPPPHPLQRDPRLGTPDPRSTSCCLTAYDRGMSRVVVHFTPTHASWMNLVEVWFSIIERQAIHRGSYRSVADLNPKIRAFITGWNERAHPFVWTKTSDQILKKANRPTTSDAGH